MIGQPLRRCLLVIGGLLAGCFADPRSVTDHGSDIQLLDIDNAVVVSLAAPQTSVAKNKDVNVLFTISNRTAKPFTILPWATPLESVLSADNFEVIYNGTTLPYVGRVVKRAAPAESDYLQLAAGEKKTVTVNLANAYDLAAAGKYRVQLKLEEGKYRASTHLLPVVSPSIVIERF